MERFKFGYTLEELKAGYASGEIKLKEDEFLGDDGLPYSIVRSRFFYGIMYREEEKGVIKACFLCRERSSSELASSI